MPEHYDSQQRLCITQMLWSHKSHFQTGTVQQRLGIFPSDPRQLSKNSSIFFLWNKTKTAWQGETKISKKMLYLWAVADTFWNAFIIWFWLLMYKLMQYHFWVALAESPLKLVGAGVDCPHLQGREHSSPHGSHHSLPSSRCLARPQSWHG